MLALPGKGAIEGGVQRKFVAAYGQISLTPKGWCPSPSTGNETASGSAGI
jgi:hypothetical protein